MKEVLLLSDQGTAFMSKVMWDLCTQPRVKQLRTSVYHPQTDGMAKRFNKTPRSMLRKVINIDGKNWDQLLPHVLWAVREVPQNSDFSPFELLYGRRPQGILDLAKEAWEQRPSPHLSVIEHIESMQQQMARIWPHVREHMKEAQIAQAHVYNRGTKVREFRSGDMVMVLLPTSDCKFLARWHGLYEVVKKNWSCRLLGMAARPMERPSDIPCKPLETVEGARSGPSGGLGH